MLSIRSWLGVYVACFLITTTFGFLDEPDYECVWYGQCGHGWNRGLLNCPANDTTKHAPLMTDPEGLRILRDYCPSLYNGDGNSRTCCDVKQLKTIENSMGFPKRFLSSCPSCLFNFINQVCQMTCSPEQSKFVWADPAATKPNSYTTGVPGITVALTNDYAKGIYDSCIDVETFLHIKAIGFLCGKKQADCTPQNWMTYIGSLSNGQAPFPIDYVFTDGQTWTSADGTSLRPLNLQNSRCNKPLNTSSHMIGSNQCICRECRAAQPCIPNPRPTSTTRKTYFDTLFGRGHYDTVEVIVSRADSHAIINHQLPPPSTDNIKFASIYDKGFLLQVLDLQNAIANVTASSAGSTIPLDDVCLKLANQNECVIESVLQYYQNNASNMEKVAYDEYHIFVLADYLDHFSQCVADPTIGKDMLPDHMSCDSSFGGVTHPYIVLERYSGDTNYPNATSYVITFLLKSGGSASHVQDWKHAFANFMGSYNNPNMTISYSPM